NGTAKLTTQKAKLIGHHGLEPTALNAALFEIHILQHSLLETAVLEADVIQLGQRQIRLIKPAVHKPRVRQVCTSQHARGKITVAILAVDQVAVFQQRSTEIGAAEMQ